MASHFLKRIAFCLFALHLGITSLQSAPLPLVKDVDWQPVRAQVQRLVQALEYLGVPLGDQTKAELKAAMLLNGPAGVQRIQEILDP